MYLDYGFKHRLSFKHKCSVLVNGELIVIFCLPCSFVGLVSLVLSEDLEVLQDWI